VLWYSEGSVGGTGLFWTESRDGGKTFMPRNSFSPGQVMGTPVVVRNDQNLYQVVWTTANGAATHVTTATLDAEGLVTKAAVGESGELPASAFSRDSFFIAYITKPQDQRIIWLIKK
jgi:hypothetical protein